MPTTRRYIRRPHRTALNHTQTMELWLGVGRDGTAFASDRERRAAWLRHCDRLMQRWGCHGRRPQAWWRYSAPEGLRRRYPGFEREQSVLWEAGVLSEPECLELEAYWKREFERVFEPNYSLCTGSGKVLTGFKAGVEHLLFVDVPPSLCDRWEREREWRGRTKPETDFVYNKKADVQEVAVADAAAAGEGEPEAAA